MRLLTLRAPIPDLLQGIVQLLNQALCVRLLGLRLLSDLFRWLISLLLHIGQLLTIALAEQTE
jgi:hypothetical protein